MIASVDLREFRRLYANIVANHAKYVYGGKPDMDADSHNITGSDCSGLSRYLCRKASGGLLDIPDGSQNQREYFEGSGAHQIGNYHDILQADPTRLIIHFIKPFTNGCGSVGHVFFTHRYWSMDVPPVWAAPRSIEAHGPEGAPIAGRPWDYHTLVNEWYSGFEIPTK